MSRREEYEPAVVAASPTNVLPKKLISPGPAKSESPEKYRSGAHSRETSVPAGCSRALKNSPLPSASLVETQNATGVGFSLRRPRDHEEEEDAARTSTTITPSSQSEQTRPAAVPINKRNECGIPLGARAPKIRKEPGESEERCQLNRRLTEIPEKLYGEVLRSADLQSVLLFDEASAQEWIEIMAAIQAETDRSITLADYPQLKNFESRWVAALEKAGAKTKNQKLKNAEPKQENPKEEKNGPGKDIDPNGDASTPKLEKKRSSNSTMARRSRLSLGYPSTPVNLVAAFLPLRFSLGTSGLRGLLTQFYEPRLVEDVICFLERRRAIMVGSLATAEDALRAAKEEAAREPEATTPAVQKNDETAVKGFSAAAVRDLVLLIPFNTPRSVDAIDGAANISTLMKVDFDAAKLGLAEKYRIVWDCRAKIATAVSTGASAPSIGNVTSKAIKGFLSEVEKVADPDAFRRVLDKHHISYGLEKIFETGEVGVRQLASFFMRVEGHGKVLGKGHCDYWFDGKDYVPIRKKGRLSRENWRRFQTHVWDVLEKETKSYLLLLNRATASGDEASTNAERIVMLKKAMRRASYAKTLTEICLCCVDLETEATDEPVGGRRKFPEIAEQSERILSNICDAFGAGCVELASEVFEKYKAGCIPEEPKFKTCESFCRNLYRQAQAFEGLRYNSRHYIVGLRLKQHSAVPT